jgi:hypothetical protein
MTQEEETLTPEDWAAAGAAPMRSAIAVARPTVSALRLMMRVLPSGSASTLLRRWRFCVIRGRAVWCHSDSWWRRRSIADSQRRLAARG